MQKPGSTSSTPRADDAELRAKLTPTQYKVACEGSTEPPFQNAYWNHKEAGIYVDVISGQALFSSLDKFDSGTGWPSFTKPIQSAEIVERTDTTHGMVRTEVRSKTGDAHLGHVFPDGPADAGGLRYCINSASLKFIPVADLEKAGYGKYKALFAKSESPKGTTQQTETAILAGGCFWGMEEILRKVPGVIQTRVGYTGGLTERPTYNDVKKGNTGHAESIEVVFDPSKLSYAELLEKWFFKMHDPTTLNRQGNDLGSQYRSAIFYRNEHQKKIAEDIKRKIDSSGFWKKPIVTEISQASEFFAAEDYHQDYLQKNPGGYTCHFLR